VGRVYQAEASSTQRFPENKAAKAPPLAVKVSSAAPEGQPRPETKLRADATDAERTLKAEKAPTPNTERKAERIPKDERAPKAERVLKAARVPRAAKRQRRAEEMLRASLGTTQPRVGPRMGEIEGAAAVAGAPPAVRAPAVRAPAVRVPAVGVPAEAPAAVPAVTPEVTRTDAEDDLSEEVDEKEASRRVALKQSHFDLWCALYARDSELAGFFDDDPAWETFSIISPGKGK